MHIASLNGYNYNLASRLPLVIVYLLPKGAIFAPVMNPGGGGGGGGGPPMYC